MQHSERNGSKTDPMRFIQMWIIPSRRGLEPSIEQRSFSEESRRNVLKPILVPADGYGAPDAPRAPAAVAVHPDAAVYAGLPDAGRTARHRFRRGFGAYLFVVHGSLAGPELDEGGAAKIRDEDEIAIAAGAAGAGGPLLQTALLRGSRARPTTSRAPPRT